MTSNSSAYDRVLAAVDALERSVTALEAYERLGDLIDEIEMRRAALKEDTDREDSKDGDGE